MHDGFRRWMAENWLWIAVPAIVAIAALGFLMLAGDGAGERGYPLY